MVCSQETLCKVYEDIRGKCRKLIPLCLRDHLLVIKEAWRSLNLIVSNKLQPPILFDDFLESTNNIKMPKQDKITLFKEIFLDYEGYNYFENIRIKGDAIYKEIRFYSHSCQDTSMMNNLVLSMYYREITPIQFLYMSNGIENGLSISLRHLYLYILNFHDTQLVSGKNSEQFSDFLLDSILSKDFVDCSQRLGFGERCTNRFLLYQDRQHNNI